MKPSLARCAAVALLLVVSSVALPAAAQAAPGAPMLLPAAAPNDRSASPEVVSTRCEETEVVHDAQHTTSRLGRCGAGAKEDLLWHLDRIGKITGELDGHFVRSNRGAGVVVYVMDTGVMAGHDEFATAAGSRVIGGVDVAQSVPYGRSRCRSANKATAPCYSNDTELVTVSHGTSVASLIAGTNVGVAPDAQIVSVRVMNERGLATTRTYLDGLDAIVRHAWSIAAPARQTSVVNISGWVLDRLTDFDDVSRIVSYAAVEKKMRDMIAGVDAEGRVDPNGRRFVFVVAANNVDGGCGSSGVVDRFPAILGPSIDGLITVGGMTEENSSWSGSCRGGAVEVLAPAENVFSATITARDEYRGRRPNLRSGTSFAAPIISGIAALLISAHPALTPEELETWIKSTPSRVIDPDERLADGRVACANTPEPRVPIGVADGALPMAPIPSRTASYAP